MRGRAYALIDLEISIARAIRYAENAAVFWSFCIDRGRLIKRGGATERSLELRQTASAAKMLKRAVRKGQIARTMSKMRDPAHLATLLRGESPEDRQVAIASLERSPDHNLAVVVMAPLGALLRDDRADVSEDEGLRVSALMSRLGQIDATTELVELLVRNQVSQIRFSLRSLGDAGCLAAVPALHGNTALVQLDLSCNMIRVDGIVAVAEALVSNTSVQLVDLSANVAKDGGATAFGNLLAKNKTLTALDLHANQVGDSGAKALARGLASNDTLKTLDVRANDVGDLGALELLASAQSSPALTLLNLHCNYLGAKSERAMQTAGADGWRQMGSPGAEPPCVSCAQPAYLIAGGTTVWSSGESSGVLWRHKPDVSQTAAGVLRLKAATVRPQSTARKPFTPPWDFEGRG